MQTGNAFALRNSGARVSVTECDTSLNDGIKRAADVRIDEGLEGMKVGNNESRKFVSFSLKITV